MSRTLNAWLNLLENRHKKTIQLGLNRVQEVAKKLDLLNPSSTVITVAGTNGKGSTVALLESIYLHAGYQVGTYTSPHLHHFNERIKINAIPLEDHVICTAFEVIEHARKDIALTYFEVVTLAGLWCFKQSDLDLIILEVGMGGRLDATNIVDPDVAIITTVDLDHQLFLGNDKEAIGFEKAGIARTNRPVIYADKDIPHRVAQHAHNIDAHLIQSGYDYQIDYNENQKKMYRGFNAEIHIPNTSMHETHIGASLTAVLVNQNKLPVPFDVIQNGLMDVKLAGRLFMHEGERKTLFDVAHNPQATRRLSEHLIALKATGKVHAIWGALKDKDLCGLIEPLGALIDEWYPSVLNDKRTADSLSIERAFKQVLSKDIQVQLSPEAAYTCALENSGCNDLLVVFGSFVTVSSVMKHLNIHNDG